MQNVGSSTHPDGESYDDLHARVVKFIGSFAQMQFSMDSAVEMFLRVRLPHLGPVLHGQFLARQRDEQRLPCFLAFTEEIGYAPDLSPLKRIYMRAKQTRDLVGHSLAVQGPVWISGGHRIVSVTRLQTTKTNLVPSPLVPSTFDRLANDCDWIGAHASRALFEADVIQFMTMTGDPAEPPVPSTLPLNGEPL